MNVSFNERSRDIYKKEDGIISRKIAGETLLVPVMGGLADMQRIFSLGRVADFIWEQIDGRSSVSEINEKIVAVFDVDKQEAGADLIEFLDELIEKQLISKI